MPHRYSVGLASAFPWAKGYSNVENDIAEPDPSTTNKSRQVTTMINHSAPFEQGPLGTVKITCG